MLCFKLQESRIAVVSSTAAATLRQLVMFVVDKMVLEVRLAESDKIPTSSLKEVTKLLGPSARDAFLVFEDLCLLTSGEKPTFLKLELLHKTFALELIESILTNRHELFRKVSIIILSVVHAHFCNSTQNLYFSCNITSVLCSTNLYPIDLISHCCSGVLALYSFSSKSPRWS